MTKGRSYRTRKNNRDPDEGYTVSINVNKLLDTAFRTGISAVVSGMVAKSIVEDGDKE